MKTRIVVIFICFLYSMSILSQDVEYSSVEQLVNDIKQRQFEKPIAFLQKQLEIMEHDNDCVFNDTIYISMATLLATSYAQTDQIYKADTLLLHAIEYLINNDKKSKFFYSLFFARGTILCQLQNYGRAEAFLAPVVEHLRNQNDIAENYAVILSVLAVCHMNLDNIILAQQEIEESISIIEKAKSFFSESNRISIYQKAGAIFSENNNSDKAIEYTRLSYDLAKNNPLYVSEFINAAQDLAVLYINDKRYYEALEILHQLESYHLSDKENSNVYNNIFLANYYLGNEFETVKYARLCSQFLINCSKELYSCFPLSIIENYWDKTAMQLKVNMGIIDRYHTNKEAIEMCYDNALFVKTLLYNNMSEVRRIIKEDYDVDDIWQKVKEIRSTIFSGDTTKYKELREQETLLASRLRSFQGSIKSECTSWKDIQLSLHDDEFAIEIISYVGFSDSEDKKVLKYCALIISHEMESPQFVELCTFQELHEVILQSLIEREYGINKLYVKDSDKVLYSLIWKALEPYLEKGKTIYVSPVLDLQSVNLQFIPCPDNSYVCDNYNIRIVTSTSVVCNRPIKFELNDAAIYGGINYKNDGENDAVGSSSFRSIVIDELQNRGSFNYLPASKKEVESICEILKQYIHRVDLYEGNSASEKTFRQLDGKSASIIHLSTHGFYLYGFDNLSHYFKKLIPYSQNDNAMIYSGLLLTGASSTLNNTDQYVLNDGIITAEEISLFDLSKTKLLVLSACETALGTSLQEGFGGLVKAFKMAGVEHIVASFWKVPDSATAKLMVSFYNYLVSGEEIHSALLKAQKDTAQVYPDPYYWASFILLD